MWGRTSRCGPTASSVQPIDRYRRRFAHQAPSGLMSIYEPTAFHFDHVSADKPGWIPPKDQLFIGFFIFEAERGCRIIYYTRTHAFDRKRAIERRRFAIHQDYVHSY